MSISRRTSLILTALGISFAGTRSLVAQTGLQLYMYERGGCPWCARWDKDVSRIYPLTDVGRRVPLRRVKLDGDRALIPKLPDPVRFTPTFVLMRGETEVSRIIGYQDEAAFWGLLERQVADALKA